MIAQLVHGWLDVTTTVALFQDVILVIVQCRHPTGHSAEILAKEGYDAEYPDRSLDAQHLWIAQFLLNQVAESFRLVNFAIAEEVFPAVHTMV